MARMIDADRLHYIPVWIATDKGETKREVVVFAKEIDRMARKEADRNDNQEGRG